MNPLRGASAILVPLFIAGLLLGQRYCGWIPSTYHGFNPWRVINVVMVVWLFYAAYNSAAPRSHRSLGAAEVECLQCRRVTDIATWESLGHCPECRHESYEYFSATRHAQYLPGAAILPEPVPEPEPPTPLAKPPLRPRGPARRLVDETVTRLGRKHKERVRRRVETVFEERRQVLRV